MTKRILVVEDDEPILDLMDLLIRRLGYEPVLLSNGPDALRYAKNDPPALILLDIMMTPISGWEFLEKLRAEPSLKTLPVIIFSASPSVEEKMASINDPFLGVLHKPVSFVELRTGIEQALKKQD
ncbi:MULTISPECIES: response regulator [unclassified Methanoregula]|uniref:response regulator n=1 Tax=unclassified Methanoregula TaxID=2649730 RepID=UPI0009CCA440|nr:MULTISPECIES: response regulator [unclassified Methanoregula]OPX62908.1 MAG: response regulator PleD [Methanoregula sp. PtaB.Bin085]OPY35121.1 MAG: response regulator PleD [Methanoregula sp. PtaU1.Bin006]